MPLTWLPDRSATSVRSALQQHAPELAGGEIELLPWLEQNDPKWCHGSAVVDKRHFVKFAWSKLAAERVWYEGRNLIALASLEGRLRTPRITSASNNPAMLVTELIAGEPLTFDLVGKMDPLQLTHTADEIGRFLADLHQPDVLADMQRAVGPLDTPLPQATTAAIRDGSHCMDSAQIRLPRSGDGATGLTSFWRAQRTRSSCRGTSMAIITSGTTSCNR